ncbi:glycosyl transferase [Cyanobacterium stanieri LEGE 03274]|uniref:Glycosyl transferase n=1 Tax=Cyanobacterium stanieri LEGE 03274 TaxID=1828756 RepID=A0ABR9V1C3_9CHRO|nr:glycosyl transferase [Cyanobacterium stanieri]MBE9221675.1 glycosyl transferase [Cyanobacterium stanieri LEGE 03274]
MSRPVLYCAITNHGFGHCVRMASVAAAVQRINPEILLVMVTTAPRWLLESYIEGDFIYRPRAFDIGVIQRDSIQMDLGATLEKMNDFRQRQGQIVAGEVEFINLNGVSLIFADIPAMVTEIAKKAGIPCWMMSNFGWDFIYRPWGDDFKPIVSWLESCYGQCDRLLRLPMHEEMSSFNHKEDMGLTGGNPRYLEQELRNKFNIHKPKEKTILLSFGGLGLQSIPYHNLALFPDWQFISFDKNAPDLPNLLKITDTYLRPVDFMPLCGRIMTKPGYSTFAEAMRLDLPLVVLDRLGFAETPLLMDGLKKYSYHQVLNNEQFFESDWTFLKQELNPPLTNEKLRKNGTEMIAQEIVNYFNN